MSLSLAEDDCFGHASEVMKIFSNMLRHGLGTTFKDDAAVIIFNRIPTFLDQDSVGVFLPILWFPTISILIKIDSNNLKWRKESVLNTLFQTVGVQRFSEIFGIIGAFFATRSRCQTNLNCRVEILENLTPTTFFFSAAAVTLVNDD